MRATLRAMARGADRARTLLDTFHDSPDAIAACKALNKALDAEQHAPGTPILPPSGWVCPV